MSRTVFCAKLGKEAEGLSHLPYPGELGQRIYENISKEAWGMWVKHQTMLINENRLSAIDPRAQTYLKEEMEKFLFGEGSAPPEGFIPENKS
jgi:Fe-S cluster biosynthesis and repair protein YggX